MTRSSIKNAIRSRCVKLDKLPKEFLGVVEGSEQAELRVPPNLVNGEANQGTGGINISKIPDGWLTQMDRFHVYQHAIHAQFEGQIVDIGQEEDVILYLVRKDSDEIHFFVTHLAWDSIRAVQLIKRGVRKGDLIIENDIDS